MARLTVAPPVATLPDVTAPLAPFKEPRAHDVQARPFATLTERDVPARRAAASMRRTALVRRGGRRLRDTVPHDARGVWRAPADRMDPLSILLAADKTRQPNLVPLRYRDRQRSKVDRD
jgi:hypothetical protein